MVIRHSRKKRWFDCMIAIVIKALSLHCCFNGGNDDKLEMPTCLLPFVRLKGKNTLCFVSKHQRGLMNADF